MTNEQSDSTKESDCFYRERKPSVVCLMQKPDLYEIGFHG